VVAVIRTVAAAGTGTLKTTVQRFVRQILSSTGTTAGIVNQSSAGKTRETTERTP
jgi:hypothetical protein